MCIRCVFGNIKSKTPPPTTTPPPRPTRTTTTTKQPFNPSTLQPFNPSPLQPFNPSTLQPFHSSSPQPFKPSSLQPVSIQHTLNPPSTLNTLNPQHRLQSTGVEGLRMQTRRYLLSVTCKNTGTPPRHTSTAVIQCCVVTTRCCIRPHARTWARPARSRLSSSS